MVSPKQVGISLFGPYLIGVELASMLLLSGLIGAYSSRPAQWTNDKKRQGREKLMTTMTHVR